MKASGRIPVKTWSLFAVILMMLFFLSPSMAERSDNAACQKGCNDDYGFCTDECSADEDLCMAGCQEVPNVKECENACRSLERACKESCNFLKSECKNACPKGKESPSEPS